MANDFKKYRGDGSARVRREVAETIGGPSFSSIRIVASVEVTCGGDQASIQAVGNLAHTEALALIDADLPDAYELFLEHISGMENRARDKRHGA